MEEQLPGVIKKALLARTRSGKIFKVTAFWVALAGLFVIPLGTIVLYYLWKHGDRIAAEDGIEISPDSGEFS